MALRLIKPGTVQILARCSNTTGAGAETFTPVGDPVPGVEYGTALRPGVAGLYRVEVTYPPGVSGTVKISSVWGTYQPTSYASYLASMTRPAYVTVTCDTPGVEVTVALTKLT